MFSTLDGQFDGMRNLIEEGADSGDSFIAVDCCELGRREISEGERVLEEDKGLV